MTNRDPSTASAWFSPLAPVLRGEGPGVGLAKQCREAGQSLFHFCSARRHGSVLQISVLRPLGNEAGESRRRKN